MTLGLVLGAAGCSGDVDTRASATAERATGTDRPTTTDPVDDADDGAPAATGPSGAATPSTPDTSPASADFRPDPAQWTRCDDLECAGVEVPLDWSDPAAGTIRLSVVRHRAEGERSGSLFINPGGPGGSGVAFLEGAVGLFGEEVRRRFDLISWDPRGVGASEGIDCARDTVADYLALDPSPDTPAESATLDDTARTIAEDCGRTDGRLLPHVSTPDVARDLEALRIATGDEPLNYLGFSYGTSIGQWYADAYPNRIRTMVLDGVVDTAEGFTDVLEGQAAAFTASLEGMDRACDGRCPAPIMSTAATLGERVERQHLPAVGGAVGPAELGLALVSASYTPDSGLRLSTALDEGLAGRGDALRDLADEYTELTGFTSYAAVVCADSASPKGTAAFDAWAADTTRRWPLVGAGVANELRVCAHWSVPPAATPKAITGVGGPPILVIGNTGDPATPYEDAERVAGRLIGARLLTVDGDGHTAYGGSPCVDERVDAYLLEGRMPAPGTRCPG